MGFLGVFRAIYDYVPQAEGELTFADGDLLYILDKNDDDGWWKAKRKAGATDEDEPEGLVPNNYVEPVGALTPFPTFFSASALSQARAIYEYTRQTDEELSFPEDALLQIFDTSDPDWILAGHEDEYGFVPSNYIEVHAVTSDVHTTSRPAPPVIPDRPQHGVLEKAESAEEAGCVLPSETPVSESRGSHSRMSTSPCLLQDGTHTAQDDRMAISEVDEEDQAIQSPSLPPRPQSRSGSQQGFHGYPQARGSVSDNTQADEPYHTPGGFHLYNVNEMVSVMGKRKKMPTTLGINLKTRTILIAPEHTQDDPAQEWMAAMMTHYSREGKHVFMELVRPSKSVDLHAGAKDTAEEIVAALGELAGAIRAEGLKEVIMPESQRPRRQGKVLYDFMAQGDDEVTVAAGDEVLILDDSKSEDWWHIHRLRNAPTGTGSRTDSIRSTIEQNRSEEIRLTKEAVRRGRREQGRTDIVNLSKVKSRPDPSKVKTWTDRTGSFSVEAQFVGLKDGKIQLHKMNGVKIAVPIAKMSRGDLEYVENVTGVSLDDDKPLADVKRSNKFAEKRSMEMGASAGKKEKPEYDWFQFFLSCDVSIGLCERYAQAFIRDSMDESVLPDVNGTILRTLGLREGDIIKVMRKLDEKFGRDSSKSEVVQGDNISGGLFSGPGGALRNNTRKSRPAPAVQMGDVVDSIAITTPAPESDVQGRISPTGTNTTTGLTGKGFEDDAWDTKPAPAMRHPPKESKQTSMTTDSAPPLAAPAFAGSMKDLSQLAEPLEPIRIEPQSTPASNSTPATKSAQHSTTVNSSIYHSSNSPSSSPQALARQRPMPPSMSSDQGSSKPLLLQRPSSDPQSTPQAVFVSPKASLQTPGPLQSRVAPPGHSLNDLRLQQHYATQTSQHQPPMTGYAMLQPQAMASFSAANPGQQQQQFVQPAVTGMQRTSPFADPGQPAQFPPICSQPTGFQPSYSHSHMSSFGQNGGVNSFLQPPLQPQRTAVTSMPLRQAGNLGGFVQPLQPQKTGPAPPVRFGVSADIKGLAPQPTGRRANLAQATPDNPFGF
ncbi:hypothetical protein XA68_18266 [Ophiocordyceps unilateralis]|uniref:Actin cytoskeleton-regulatory complex protein SLA1 n=1 Tax=Ophiocordyceps unilateralis TaxID=268505 RepID=A0A2A9P3E0_OPHUN|nr:hypothetical protein XA68_18266 [Ophiocordyceps unilateralis]